MAEGLYPALPEWPGLNHLKATAFEAEGMTIWVCSLGCHGGGGAPAGVNPLVCPHCGMSTLRPLRELKNADGIDE